MPWLAVRLDPDWVAVCESSSGRLGILFEHGVEFGPGFSGPLPPAGLPGRRVTLPFLGEAQQAAIDERAKGPMKHRLTQWPAGPRSHCEVWNAWCCVEALCFGDFHLGQQMKVTRLPGRIPGGLLHRQNTQTRKQPA